MSRIGNKPITVPSEVTVKIEGQKVTVTGPKGTLEKEFDQNITIELDGNIITVSRNSDEKKIRSLHGLTITETYSKELQINGVGYRVAKQGKDLNLTLGYSHPVIFTAPTGIDFDVPNTNTIIVRGIDKELVGQTAAEIRTKRPPEVYRGKGIKYADEVIRRKEGKTGK